MESTQPSISSAEGIIVVKKKKENKEKINACKNALAFTAFPKIDNPKGQSFLAGSKHAGSSGHTLLPVPDSR